MHLKVSFRYGGHNVPASVYQHPSSFLQHRWLAEAKMRIHNIHICSTRGCTYAVAMRDRYVAVTSPRIRIYGYDLP